jgi:hypothetical protein
MAQIYGAVNHPIKPETLMKYVILMLILELVLVSAVAEETTYSLHLDKNTVNIQANDGSKITLSVGRLFYKDKNGGTIATEDSYLVEVIDDHSPRIIDALNGHTVSFQLVDVDENKGNEVLAFYYSGGHQYGVKIYKVEGTEIKPLKTQPGSSNMRSVKLNGKDIVVENEERNDDGITFIDTDIYRVVGYECKLVKTEKTTVPNKDAKTANTKK